MCAYADEAASYFMEISPFLSDTWFGSVDSDGHLVDSRWAGFTTPTIDDIKYSSSFSSEISDDEDDEDDEAASVFTVQPNSYGYIRSYWNNNDDGRLKRILFSVCGQEPANKKVRLLLL
jgi:hypothetical protein